MSDIFDDVLKACMNLVSVLMDLEPVPGTPEANLLIGLADAIEAYEKTVYGDFLEVKGE